MFRLSIAHAFFFFNDTATTEIYTLSLHDALPIYARLRLGEADLEIARVELGERLADGDLLARSEEHTSELQSRPHLVCRLLLEKKRHEIRCRICAHVAITITVSVAHIHLARFWSA